MNIISKTILLKKVNLWEKENRWQRIQIIHILIFFTSLFPLGIIVGAIVFQILYLFDILYNQYLFIFKTFNNT
jgi:hypothetical protein